MPLGSSRLLSLNVSAKEVRKSSGGGCIAVLSLLEGKFSHRLVIVLLSFCNREPGVTRKLLPALESGIGLNERIIDSLLFEPGEEKMPPFVWGHRTSNPRSGAIVGQHLAYSPVTVLAAARGLEDIRRGSFMHLHQMHAKQFPERERERNDAIFVAIAPVDPYLTPLQIDIAEAHIEQLTDSHSGIEQYFDEHHIRELVRFPNSFVEALDLILVKANLLLALPGF
jgi:hypothetical protein